MKIVRSAAAGLVVVLGTAAVVSFVVQFNRTDRTTGLLAGGAVVLCTLLIATRGRGKSADRR